MSLYPHNIPRCQHIKVNGTQCGSPALRRNRLCYFHKSWQQTRIVLGANRARRARAVFDLPMLEDANSIQVALMQVMRLILSGQIDAKNAGLLLYALQTASTNLSRTNFEPTIKTRVVIDPRTVNQTPLGEDPWRREDYEEEDEYQEEDPEENDEAVAAEEESTEEQIPQIQAVAGREMDGVDCAGVQLRANGAAKPVGDGKAGVGRYAHSHRFLDIGGIEIFGGLASVAAGDEKIHAGVHATVEKRSDQGAAKFLHRRACAFGGQDGQASRAQRLGAYVLEFSSCLQMKR